MSVELLVVVDNTASRADLACEHGLSVLVSGPRGKFLFDTGATADALLANATVLGADLSDLDGVILSHGHYDHTGGLAAVATQRPGLPIYAHPAVFRRRWSHRPGKTHREISCPHPRKSLEAAGAVFHPIDASNPLADWLVLSGPVPGPMHGREVFVVEHGDDTVADGFEDEQFCLLRAEGGWAVLTGCCHRGLANTLAAANNLAGGEPVIAVFGGLHLRRADEDELRAVVELLRQAGSPAVYPCHCTGDEATRFLAEHLPGRVTPLSAGRRVVI